MRKTPNAKRLPVDVVGSSTFGRYSKISSATTYNMFISDGWLINFAGYQKIYEFLPKGEGRGLFHSVRGNLLIVVVNSFVYSLDINLVPTFIGALATSTGEVFIDENLANQICIVDGIHAYIYNHSEPPNLTIQNFSLNPFSPNFVCYHNTYFLFGSSNTGQLQANWYAYAPSGSSVYEIDYVISLPLQTKPDYPLAVTRIPGWGNNVLVMGSTVSEIWTQVGGSEVYRRNSTVNIDYGCLSVDTIAAGNEYVMWLAVNENNSPVIMAFSKQGAQPISTDGIDYVMNNLKFPEQSTAMFYAQDGHVFYQLTFYNEADNVTLAYDLTTKTFFNLSDSGLNYHPARNFAYFNNNSYFVSLNNAALYQADTNFTYNNENIGTDTTLPLEEIQRIRICSPIRDPDSSRFIVNSLVLTLEQGCDPNVTQLALDNYDIDLITEDIFNPPNAEIITEWGDAIVDESSWGGAPVRNNPPYQPRVDLSVSRDGGITWSSTVSRTLHPIGWRQNILTWEKMGMANDLTFKFRFWGLYRFVVHNGVVDVYGGMMNAAA